MRLLLVAGILLNLGVTIWAVNTVKYCDGVYQLINREDESREVCGEKISQVKDIDINLDDHEVIVFLPLCII